MPAVASARRGVFAGDWRRVLALCGLTLLYAAALPILGFTLATAGFLAASFRLLGERRFGALVVVPLAIAVVFLVLLRGALGAYLPEPLLETAAASRSHARTVSPRASPPRSFRSTWRWSSPAA